MLSLNHGVYIIEKGYKKTVCPDGKYFHQNKLFFIFTLIIFSEHSYFLRKSQITPERKQRKKDFLTPFALHWNIQTARKAFIYRLFRNLVLFRGTPHYPQRAKSSILTILTPHCKATQQNHTANPHSKSTQPNPTAKQNPPALQRNSTAHSAVVILTTQLLLRPI